MVSGQKATEGIMLTPASTNVPIKGKAINAGIKVTVPRSPPPTVAKKTERVLKNEAMSAGGISDKIRPMAKTIESMLTNILRPNLKAIRRAFFVFFLSFAREIARKINVAPNDDGENIHVNLLFELLRMIDRTKGN